MDGDRRESERDAATNASAHRLGNAKVVALAFGIAGMLLIAAVAGLPVYVFPPASAAPQRADLVYVIGPPVRERLALAEDLRARGVADRILVSVLDEGHQSADGLSICRRAEVTCVHPDPFTTNGEAAVLERLEPGTDVVVITFTPHVARTRMIFDRCFGGTTTVIAAPTELDLREWAYQYAYQSAGFVKAWFTPCA